MSSNSTPATSSLSQSFQLSFVGQVAVLVSLASYVFDAPLRYVLSIARIESALYFRDLVFSAVIFSSLLSWVLGKTFNRALIPLYIITLHLFWGFINLPSIAQPVVGLKIFLTYLAGIICYDTYKKNEKACHRYATAAFAITAAAVILNAFIEMPWSGTSFASATGDVNVSREWTSGGVKRVAGFGRSSTETAALLALLCAPLLFASSLSKTKKIFLYFFTFGLIALTTTKGALIAWATIGIAAVFFKKADRSNLLYSASACIAATGIALPAIIYAYDLRASVSGDFWWLLSSFADRINRMWPGALENTHDYGSLILGRGLGGIGFPQMFGEGIRFNSADSVMLYLYANFGIFGIAYTFIIIKKFSENKAHISPGILYVLLTCLLYWVTYGLVGNNAETPLMLFSAGLITAAGQRYSSARGE